MLLLSFKFTTNMIVIIKIIIVIMVIIALIVPSTFFPTQLHKK